MMNPLFSEKLYKCLVGKVLKFNDKNKYKLTVEKLIRVYKRGEKVADTNWQPQKTTAQWAMARVNMFLELSAGRKVKKDYRFHDIDIIEGTDRTHQQEEADPFWNFNNLDFTSARTDLLLAKITDSESEKIFYPSTVEEV